jgi:hypothetical protein
MIRAINLILPELTGTKGVKTSERATADAKEPE